jgi:hypothetical protein
VKQKQNKMLNETPQNSQIENEDEEYELQRMKSAPQNRNVFEFNKKKAPKVSIDSEALKQMQNPSCNPSRFNETIVSWIETENNLPKIE